MLAGLISAQTQRQIHRGGYQPGSLLQALTAAVVSEVMESNVPPSAQTYRKYFNSILQVLEGSFDTASSGKMRY